MVETKAVPLVNYWVVQTVASLVVHLADLMENYLVVLMVASLVENLAAPMAPS